MNTKVLNHIFLDFLKSEKEQQEKFKDIKKSPDIKLIKECCLFYLKESESYKKFKFLWDIFTISCSKINDSYLNFTITTITINTRDETQMSVERKKSTKTEDKETGKIKEIIIPELFEDNFFSLSNDFFLFLKEKNNFLKNFLKQIDKDKFEINCKEIQMFSFLNQKYSENNCFNSVFLRVVNKQTIFENLIFFRNLTKDKLEEKKIIESEFLEFLEFFFLFFFFFETLIICKDKITAEEKEQILKKLFCEIIELKESKEIEKQIVFNKKYDLIIDSFSFKKEIKEIIKGKGSLLELIYAYNLNQDDELKSLTLKGVNKNFKKENVQNQKENVQKEITEEEEVIISEIILMFLEKGIEPTAKLILEELKKKEIKHLNEEDISNFIKKQEEELLEIFSEQKNSHYKYENKVEEFVQKVKSGEKGPEDIDEFFTDNKTAIKQTFKKDINNQNSIEKGREQLFLNEEDINKIVNILKEIKLFTFFGYYDSLNKEEKKIIFKEFSIYSKYQKFFLFPYEEGNQSFCRYVLIHNLGNIFDLKKKFDLEKKKRSPDLSLENPFSLRFNFKCSQIVFWGLEKEKQELYNLYCDLLEEKKFFILSFFFCMLNEGIEEDKETESFTLEYFKKKMEEIEKTLKKLINDRKIEELEREIKKVKDIVKKETIKESLEPFFKEKEEKKNNQEKKIEVKNFQDCQNLQFSFLKIKFLNNEKNLNIFLICIFFFFFIGFIIINLIFLFFKILFYE